MVRPQDVRGTCEMSSHGETGVIEWHALLLQFVRWHSVACRGSGVGQQTFLEQLAMLNSLKQTGNNRGDEINHAWAAFGSSRT
jgi:hypothetical protein